MEPPQKPPDVVASASPPEACISSAEPVDISLIDAAVGTCFLVLSAATTVGHRVRPLLEPVAHAVLSPPVLLPARLNPRAVNPRHWNPRHWLESLVRRGAEQRAASQLDISRLLDALVPVAVEELLRRIDLTDVVVRHVNLTEVVAAVDLDAAASRLDVNAIAERLDLDAVAGRLDLDAVLDRLDLTAVVLTRVDLDVLIRSVLERLDLPGLAEEVIDAVDLPEIIRESTGSMASDAVRGVRLQGIAADEAIGRVRSRLLLHRGHSSGGPRQPQTSEPPAADPAGPPGAPPPTGTPPQ
jgi:hypothetical protein